MSKRDIAQEILDGIDEIKSGGGHRYTLEFPTDVKKVREVLSLSQSAFAAILGVSVRTLQDWEQGRRKPSGPARSLLLVASKKPKVLLEVFRNLPKEKVA